MLATPPLGLYVHFPWCVRKCPYCDFNSYTLHGGLPEDAYVEALLADMREQAQRVAGRPLVSVFMGGGTPSLFSPAAIGRVLAGARAIFSFEPGIEITLEANPGTIERGRFEGYAGAGVNRVSLGAQSFGAAQLAALGRIHSPDDTRRAVAELKAAGLANFNLDLMYGLPGQDEAGARSDLAQALALEPTHLSHYSLTMEPGTPFHAQPPPLPDDELVERMLAACAVDLDAAGLGHYEVSAYARPGRESRHNLNYWTFGDYLGVGAGAHGKLTDAAAGVIVRTTRTREPRRYLAGTGAMDKTVAAAELPFEFMVNALRLVDGVDPALFEARTGLPRTAVAQTLAGLAARGLLEVDESRWRPTALGRRFLNELLLDFLGKPEPAGNTKLSSLPG